MLRSKPQEPLARGELPPPKVAWLHPLELARTAYHAWLSQVATSYLDRREVLAALDRDPTRRDKPVPAPTSAATPADPWTCVHRHDLDGRVDRTPPQKTFDGEDYFSSPRHQREGVWIDFMADVGDSWEATHAVASLMAQHELKVRGRDVGLPHADLVVLGGDLVYPAPGRDSYRRRTREPIGAAFPQAVASPDIPRRRLVAIPGNHDWYDGLTSFVREFCQGGELGGWQLVQGRSYFALKLMRGWWVWGIDIALDTRIDPAQQAYFLDILENRNLRPGQSRFERGDRIILCTAKPSWLRSSRYSDDAYENLEFFVREFVAQHNGVVAMMLSGDLHHYSRYQSHAGHQFITSGSGGSYLMGTHHLPAETRPFDEPPQEAQEDEPNKYLHSAFVRSEFTYPSQTDSRRLALGALRLAFRRANIPFCLTIGLIALWMTRMVDRVAPTLLEQEYGTRAAVHLRFDFLALMSALVIVFGCGWFAAASNKKAWRVLTWPWGLMHGVAHLALIILIAMVLMPNPLHRIGAPGPPYLQLPPPYESVATALSMLGDATVFVLIAGWIGATLVGLYLTVSDKLGWHQNDVFAAQSICDYRSFVRIHLSADGRATVYPIGLRHVPRSWRARLVRNSPSDPLYEPTDAELLPHLIEGPINVMVSQASSPPATTV